VRVEGLLKVTVSEPLTEQLVRASRGRPATGRIQRQFTISSEVEPDALVNAIEQVGWRVYATNQTGDGRLLSQAVEASRDESVVERTFGRVKGPPCRSLLCLSSGTIMPRAWSGWCRLPCGS
jgi:hypothetical protein